VIDDNSNSEDSTIPNTNNIPTKPIPSTPAQTAHIPIPTSLSPPKHGTYFSHIYYIHINISFRHRKWYS
jgi:hypothetical protein